MYTKSIADEVADDIDFIFYEKVKTALTLANTPIIKKVLETSNFSYASLPDEKRTKSIKLQNETWKSIKETTDKFILKFTDNKVSHFLKNQQAILKGEYGEIFLTNKFGALVASTSKLSTFAHGHKYWWLGSYFNGKGAVFFDDRGYDDSVGGYVLGLVVPVRKGMEIIGILKCNLNILGSVSQLISGAENKLIGKFKLTRSGGMVVYEEGFEPLSTQLHDSIFKKLKNKNIEPLIISESGTKYLVGFSEIQLTKGEEGYGFGGKFESIDHKKGNIGESWYILCYRQMSVVLSPIIESIKSIVLMGTVIIFVLLSVSYLFGRKIAKPLAKLDKAAAKIGKGDFEYRIDMRQKDEFGNLASSFNSMANNIQHRNQQLQYKTDELKKKNLELDTQKKLQKNMLENLLKEKTKSLQKTNRELLLHSECNKVIVQAENETDMLNDISRIIVESGDYILAWIGFAVQDKEKRVCPASYYGFSEGYLENLNITWADTELGRGPTGTAIRENRLVISKTISSDPEFLPWKQKAQERSYLSSIALPLIFENKSFGALNIYASEEDAFSTKETALLEELANDLAHAITAIRFHENIRCAEESLQIERDKLQNVVNCIGDCMYIVNKDYILVFQNNVSIEQFGDRPGTKCYKTFFQLNKPCDFCLVEETMSENRIKHVETNTALPISAISSN